jgi:hypothetical protein
LVVATPENVEKTRQFLDHLKPGGAAVAGPAMGAAMRMKPDIIFLMAGGDFADGGTLADAIHKLNEKKHIEINTVALINPAQPYRRVLARIAKENGGLMRYVTRADLQEESATTKPAGELEFHEVVSDPKSEAPQMFARLQEQNGKPAVGPVPQPGDTMRWYELDEREADSVGNVAFDGKRYVLVWTTADKSMAHTPGGPPWAIVDAYPTLDQDGRRMVGFKFDAGGAAIFSDLTGQNIGKPLAIILDGRVLAAPTVQSRISGSGVITGGGPNGYGAEEANALVKVLKGGGAGR